MKETWKSIIDWPKYEVSTLGRVRNINGTIKVPFISDQGYYKVQLFSRGKKKNHRVHRLVAKAFIPNLDNKIEINHKNLNKLDNSVSNLEWMTGEENINHYLVIKSKIP